MSTEQLEQRLTAVEKALADVQQKVDAISSGTPTTKWWERIGRQRTPEEQTTFDEAMAYGRYYRKTGQEPPPDWKPGDPIPEPDFDS